MYKLNNYNFFSEFKPGRKSSLVFTCGTLSFCDNKFKTSIYIFSTSIRIGKIVKKKNL